MSGEPHHEVLERLRCDMERVRAELHRALDRACGNHLDADVQTLSRRFDQLLAAYTRLTRGRSRRRL